MADERLRILLVEDSPEDREVVKHFLKRDPTRSYEVLEATSADEVLARLHETPPACILLDYGLPDCNGLELVEILRTTEVGAAVPVIMLTGQGNEAVAVQAMKRGCEDYVVKDDVSPSGLSRAIANAIEKVALRREIEAKKEALARSQRQQLEIKDRFLSHVSHELRTPLGVVHQFLSLLLDGVAGELGEEQREYARIAFRNAQQLRNMIADLMEATRAESGKLRIELGRVEVAEIVGETVKALERNARSRGVDLCTELPADLPAVAADATRARQVLNNLIDNAVKFTPEGGAVRVSADLDPEHADGVRFSVSDTGCGISAGALERIFDRLHQEREDEWESRQGLGLGLSICRELMRLQHGRIWAESEVGRGSTFHFRLPVYSVARLIAPVLAPEGRLQPSLGLVRVGLAPAGADPAPVRKLQRVLEGCVSAYGDVVLPPDVRSHGEVVLAIVAATDAAGLEALRARVARRVGKGEGGLPVSIGTCLEALPEAQGADPDQVTALLEHCAARVEALLADPSAFGVHSEL